MPKISSSTTQQSQNLLRPLIIASELFQVLMSASTDPGACVVWTQQMAGFFWQLLPIA